MKKIINLMAVLLWFIILKNTDSYYLPYVIIGLLGSFSLLQKRFTPGLLEKIFTIIYSLMIYIANYNLFWNNQLTNPNPLLNIAFGIGKSTIFFYAA